MERFFQVAAVILAGIAAYFLWNGNSESAFVAVIFGAVSFFLSVRFQVKERLREREIEREEEEMRKISEEEIEEAESPLLNEMSAERQMNKEQRTNNNEPPNK